MWNLTRWTMIKKQGVQDNFLFSAGGGGGDKETSWRRRRRQGDMVEKLEKEVESGDKVD